MKLDLMSTTARPSEQPFTRPAVHTSGVGLTGQPFTRPVIKTSGVRQVHNTCSSELSAMHTKKHNVNELVLDLTSRVSHMNISTNNNATSSNDSASTNSNAPSMPSESSSTNSNARLTSDATLPPDSNPTTHSTEDDGCVSSIASPLTNANEPVSTSDTSPTNGIAERDTKHNVSRVTNSDIEDIEKKLSSLNVNIKPDAEERQSAKDDVKATVDEVGREKVEDDKVDVDAKDLDDVEGDSSIEKVKEEKDKDDVLKRTIKVAVNEEERRDVIKGAVNEEKTPNEPPKTEVKVSSGGNLCPRSPMRPEFNQQRIEPYNQTSRNAHHSGGRIVQVSTPDVTEPISSISLHQNSWLNTCNISPLQTPSDAYVTQQPVYPFISCSSSPQGQTYVDEGYYDVDINSDGFCLADVSNAAYEGTNEENLLGDGSVLADLAADDEFCKLLEKYNSTPDDVCASPNAIPVSFDIPESVLAYEANSPQQTSWRTESMIPSVGSSGYHSSSSPRSTSTPSPTSLQESQDRYPCSPVDTDIEWHGTASDVYNEDDIVFNSDLLDSLDLGADVPPQSIIYTEVFQTMPCFALYDASSELASSLVHVPMAVPQFRQNITPLLPNITQVLPNVGQQTCPAVGVGHQGPVGNRVLKRIQPKPSTTAKSATQRMTERLNKERKGKIWAKISTITDEDIVQGDEDGDTQLMILLVQEPTKEQGKVYKLEFVYALVERLKRIPGALTSVNSQQESALYLAALHCSNKDSALITRYIAEAMLEAHANVDMVYKGGDTLMHCLCRDGANRYEVLKELLSLKDANSRLYFDINKYNDKGLTPLLEAVNSHGHSDSTKSIRLLLDAGADSSLTVRATPTTALHLAIETSCHPNLVDALLTDAHLATVCSNRHYREAGVLHLAAGRNDVAADRQRHVMDALVAAGARREERDREGRLPCERLSAERKEAFKS